MNILQWWKDNGSNYPSLYLAVKSTLSIPATSVPAERIFSLAGFIVNKRRAQLKADKVNKLIYVNRNRAFIPEKTSVFAPEDRDSPVPSTSRE